MINIYYCVDKNPKLKKQQYLSLISLAHTCKEPLNVINLTLEVPEYSAKSKKFGDEEDAICTRILKEANPQSSYRSIDVTDLFREHLLKDSVNAHNMCYNLFVTVRLLADLVPEIPDKVIYLDSDTFMLDDISKLWNLDMEGVELVGRRDRFRVGKYIQTGVMLMDMKKMRENGTMRKACDLCRNKHMLYIDMTAINKACKNKKVVSKIYNSYVYRPDAIIHHVCATRESNIPLTKKYYHRIKPDEEDFMRPRYPAYNYIYDKYNELMKEFEEEKNSANVNNQ